MVDVAIEAMDAFMRSGDNANHGGVFAAAHATDVCVERARDAVGRLLGADPRGVAFGPSMTAMTMRLSAAVGRTLRPADEVVVTRLDHDANVRPWVIAAERAGATVRWAEPDRSTLALPAAAVEAALSDRTRWVAVTAASNACGTVPELEGIVAAAHGAGARISIDAVAAVPHRPLDLRALGADTLACSSYKWYGPHIGVLCAAPELLEELVPDKLNPSPDEAPDRFELGTLPFESLAGVTAAAEYMLEVGYDAIRAHEDRLLAIAADGLAAIDGVTLYGDPPDRVPTLMFNVEGRTSTEVAAALAEREIAVWDGNYYAWELERFLGLEPHGAVRAGFVHYNDESDAARLVSAVADVASGALRAAAPSSAEAPA
jgi:cysteine desulfurase family protein (TIGR01976 family)